MSSFEKLGNLISFRTGKLNSNAAVVDGEYPFFTCSQETYRTSICSFNTECVLLAGNNANGIYPLKYFKGKFDAYQRTYVFEPLNKEQLETRYLYFALRPQLEHLRSISTGAATKFLTLTILREIEIACPPIGVQRRIATILSAYDDLIENNTRRIAIFEEMAWRLYEEWFVRFRFPGHEQVRMVESELGLIPEEWGIGTLSNVVENLRQATKAGNHLSGRHYVPIDCIAKKSLVLAEDNSWEEAQSSLVLFERGDILFGAMRPYFHKVAIAPYPGVTRTTCFVLRPKDSSLSAFAALTMFSDAVVAYASAHTQGATIPYAVWDGSLANFKIVLPPQEMLERFEAAVSPMLRWLMQISHVKKTSASNAICCCPNSSPARSTFPPFPKRGLSPHDYQAHRQGFRARFLRSQSRRSAHALPVCVPWLGDG